MKKTIILFILLLSATSNAAIIGGQVIAGSGTWSSNVPGANCMSWFSIPPGRGMAQINLLSVQTDTNWSFISFYIATNNVVVTNISAMIHATNKITGCNNDGATMIEDGDTVIVEDVSAGTAEWNIVWSQAAGTLSLTNTTTFIPNTNDRIWEAQLLCRFPTTNVNWTKIGGPLFTIPIGLPGLITVGGHATCRIDAVTGSYLVRP